MRSQRKARGLSLRELALLADLSFKHLGEIERGRVDPGWTTLLKIARALDLRVGDLETIAYGAPDDEPRAAAGPADAVPP